MFGLHWVLEIISMDSSTTSMDSSLVARCESSVAADHSRNNHPLDDHSENKGEKETEMFGLQWIKRSFP